MKQTVIARKQQRKTVKIMQFWCIKVCKLSLARCAPFNKHLGLCFAKQNTGTRNLKKIKISPILNDLNRKTVCWSPFVDLINVRIKILPINFALKMSAKRFELKYWIRKSHKSNSAAFDGKQQIKVEIEDSYQIEFHLLHSDAAAVAEVLVIWFLILFWIQIEKLWLWHSFFHILLVNHVVCCW